MKNVVDIEALAEQHYPQPWQLAERLAFQKGFTLADPSRLRRDPQRKKRKWGERTDIFRSMNVGDSMQIPLRDDTDWNAWRSTASYFKRYYGARFSITRDPEDRTILNITRHE